jgi:hypothetical protein
MLAMFPRALIGKNVVVIVTIVQSPRAVRLSMQEVSYIDIPIAVLDAPVRLVARRNSILFSRRSSLVAQSQFLLVLVAFPCSLSLYSSHPRFVIFGIANGTVAVVASCCRGIADAIHVAFVAMTIVRPHVFAGATLQQRRWIAIVVARFSFSTNPIAIVIIGSCAFNHCSTHINIIPSDNPKKG